MHDRDHPRYMTLLIEPEPTKVRVIFHLGFTKVVYLSASFQTFAQK